MEKLIFDALAMAAKTICIPEAETYLTGITRECGHRE